MVLSEVEGLCFSGLTLVEMAFDNTPNTLEDDVRLEGNILLFHCRGKMFDHFARTYFHARVFAATRSGHRICFLDDLIVLPCSTVRKFLKLIDFLQVFTTLSFSLTGD